jgi:hypothetical protein
MKSLPERLDEQLEREIRPGNGRRPFAGGLFTNPLASDPEVDELIVIARQLGRASQLRADSRFVGELERRLRRQALIAQSPPRGRRLFWPHWRMHPALATLAICLLVITCSTTVLTLAAQDPAPGSPFYGFRQLEQHVQYSLASSPNAQADLDLQFAREHLDNLASDLRQHQLSAYAQDLSGFDQQFTAASTAIATLPSGSDRQQLNSQLAALQNDARLMLYGFLHQLDLATGLSTTTELGQLGLTIPRITSAQVQISSWQALIALTGSNLQDGAELVVNDHLTQAISSQEGDQLIFTLFGMGNQHFQSLGLLNPNGTVAQTTMISVKDLHTNWSGTPGAVGWPGGSGGNGWPRGTPTPFPTRSPHSRATPGASPTPPFQAGSH